MLNSIYEDVARTRLEDQRREAEKRLLIREALGAQPKRPGFRAQTLVWLGNWFVQRGERLQARGSVSSSQAGVPSLRTMPAERNC